MATRPICRAERRRAADAGFSTLETVVAVAVLGLVAGLAVTATRPSEGRRLAAAAAGVALLLEGARYDAAVAGAPVTVVWDPRAGRIAAGARSYELPQGVALAAGRDGMSVAIRPSGRSEGAAFALTLGPAAATVTLDWLTGRVEVVR